MSHALSIYITLSSDMYDEDKDKAVVDKRYLCSYCGSSNIYNAFRDCGVDHYCGTDGDSYAELTSSVLAEVKADVNNDIKSVETRVNEYEKHAGGNKEIIDEIIGLKEYLEELYASKSDIEFLDNLRSTLEWEGHKLFYNTY